MARPDSDVCLNDDELTSLFRGRAADDERQRYMLHLDRCAGCRSVLAESARHLERGEARKRLWRSALLTLVAALIALAVLWVLRNS